MGIWTDPFLQPIEIPKDLKKNWFQLGSFKFQLLPQQFLFMAAQEEFIGYISGVGGGKTRIGSIKAAYLSMTPGNRGLVGRFALPDLEDTAQRDLLDVLHEAQLLKEGPNAKNKRALVHCVDPETNRSLGYTSEITFQHLDDPDHLRGRHLGWFWIDEGSELRSTKAWVTLVGRLRLPVFKNRYKGMVTGNPKGRNWIYDFFFNKEILEVLTCGGRPGHHVPTCKLGDIECNRRMRLKRRAIHSRSYDNYFLPPDYVENMVASYTDEQRRREVEAEFDVFEGQIFKEFDERLHVFEPPASWIDGRPPREWRRLLAVDVGGASPWVFMWSAVDPDGNLIFYDEIWEATSDVQHLVNQATPKMKDEFASDYNWQARVIDYENKIAAEDLRRCGITMTNARKMNKSGDGGSTSLLSGYLHPNPKHHFPSWHPTMAGRPASPRAFISTRCKVLRRELPQQQWAQIVSADGFRDVMDRLIPHDTVDTALYTVRELPHPMTVKPNTFSSIDPNISKMSQMYWADRARQAELERRRMTEAHHYRVRPVTIHRP